MNEDFVKVDVKNRITRSAFVGANRIQHFKGQSYAALRSELLRTGRLFEDPVFAPVNTSLYYTQPVPPGVSWLRPQQIVAKQRINKPAAFVVDTMNAHDLDQGYLGDCWFIAGCIAITFLPELISKVVPRGQECSGAEYAGIFHFRFWIYGIWYDVVIDDYLPVWPDGRLVFCCNKEEPNDYTAYAKVCGSYENMEGGFTSDALIDMSGGIEETFTISRSLSRKEKDNLWAILCKSRALNSMNGAYIDPDPHVFEARMSNGLIKGHAYTITRIAVIEVSGRGDVRLIRVKNPWGNNAEWRGAWSDQSYEWRLVSDDVKHAVDFRVANEGEFWMSFDDFCAWFDSIQFCHLTPDAYSAEEPLPHTQSSQHHLPSHKRSAPERLRQTPSPQTHTATHAAAFGSAGQQSTTTWKMLAYHGEWIAGESAGGSGNGGDPRYWTNPQFLVKLVDVDATDSNVGEDQEHTATAIVSLMQKWTREKRTKAGGGEPCEEFIQFRVFRLAAAADRGEAERAIARGERLHQRLLERVSNSGNYINKREVTKRFRLTAPGFYVIVPSTFDYGSAGEFLLRVFTERPIDDKNTRILTRSEQIEQPVGGGGVVVGGGSSGSGQWQNTPPKVMPKPKPQPQPQPQPPLIPSRPPHSNLPRKFTSSDGSDAFGGSQFPSGMSSFFQNPLDMDMKSWISALGQNIPLVVSAGGTTSDNVSNNVYQRIVQAAASNDDVSDAYSDATALKSHPEGVRAKLEAMKTSSKKIVDAAVQVAMSAAVSASSTSNKEAIPLIDGLRSVSSLILSEDLLKESVRRVIKKRPQEACSIM